MLRMVPRIMLRLLDIQVVEPIVKNVFRHHSWLCCRPLLITLLHIQIPTPNPEIFLNLVLLSLFGKSYRVKSSVVEVMSPSREEVLRLKGLFTLFLDLWKGVSDGHCCGLQCYPFALVCCHFDGWLTTLNSRRASFHGALGGVKQPLLLCGLDFMISGQQVIQLLKVIPPSLKNVLHGHVVWPELKILL